MSTPLPWGTEFIVNTTAFGYQGEVTLTALPTGHFVAAWTDLSQSGGDQSGYAVRAQVCDARGGKIGPEFVGSTTTGGDQSAPALATLANGSVVGVWVQDHGPNPHYTSDVRGRIASANGSAGVEFTISTTMGGDALAPTVAALTNGRFVVAWQDYGWKDGDVESYAVRAHLFTGWNESRQRVHGQYHDGRRPGGSRRHGAGRRRLRRRLGRLEPKC